MKRVDWIRTHQLQARKAAQRADALSAMPITPDQLHRLLAHLGVVLGACDRTPKVTASFLRQEGLNEDDVLAWLGEHGGYCDCEVLLNLHELDSSLQPPRVDRTRPCSVSAQPERELVTPIGWDFSQLPRPWRVANRFRADQPLQIQFGKKNRCLIRFLEGSLPDGDATSDGYWKSLWNSRTELPPRGILRVERGVLDLPAPLTSTLVRSSSWTPVFCWVFGHAEPYFFEASTESDRYAGDLPQIAALISHLVARRK